MRWVMGRGRDAQRRIIPHTGQRTGVCDVNGEEGEPTPGLAESREADVGRDTDERRGSRWVALALLSGLTGAFAGSVLVQRESGPRTLGPDPLLRAENQQQLVIGMQAALAEGDEEFASWIMTRLAER